VSTHEKATKLVHGTFSKVTDHRQVDTDRDLPMSVPGDFEVAVVGDVVITRPVSQLTDPEVQAALEPVRSADFAIANLEQTIANWREFEGHHYGIPSFLVMADPSVADDLAEIGFDVMSRANNRLSDFGSEGNRQTDAHLRRVGIVPVGYGEHLAEARAPAYADIANGRVGVVSLTSSANHGHDRVFGAGARIANSNGRPGANNIRVSRTVKLPTESWERLRQFALEHDYAFPGPFVVQPTVMVFEDRFQLHDTWYEKGDEPGYSYRIHPDDLSDVLRSTRNAALFSNYTIVTIHAHQWTIDPSNPQGGLAGETPHPPDFLIELAHDAIDNGADLFFVHGPFDFRAIEIYRGKPIFYGIGCFLRQAYMQELIAWETYRGTAFGDQNPETINPYATETTDAELLAARTARHPSFYFEGATAICRYHDSELSEIVLHPIDLGFRGNHADFGTPRAASPEVAERIFDRIAATSAPFGTSLDLRDGVGIVKID
jgi:poly-gamma-glutamate synthesis protein (capsule biosynthesis protein)